MDENSARSLYEQRINALVKQMLPNGAGSMTEQRLRYALEQVAQTAFAAGEDFDLMDLLTIEEVATQLGISARRVRAIAKTRHERSGVGYQVPGTRSQWLFRSSEIESLRPGPPGRPKHKNDLRALLQSEKEPDPSDDIARGRYKSFGSMDEMIEDLDKSNAKTAEDVLLEAVGPYLKSIGWNALAANVEGIEQGSRKNIFGLLIRFTGGKQSEKGGYE